MSKDDRPSDGSIAEARRLTRRIRVLLGIFVVGLVVSGVTAFPLVWEIALLRSMAGSGTVAAEYWPALSAWIEFVYEGLTATSANYPFLAYGTDWLAFAHIVIAVAFWGPFRDPIRNRWVVEFGMIACVLVIPLALICGPLRGIPPFWRAIDCSFGVFGILPLALVWRDIRDLERLTALSSAGSDESGG